MHPVVETFLFTINTMETINCAKGKMRDCGLGVKNKNFYNWITWSNLCTFIFHWASVKMDRVHMLIHETSTECTSPISFY